MVQKPPGGEEAGGQEGFEKVEEKKEEEKKAREEEGKRSAEEEGEEGSPLPKKRPSRGGRRRRAPGPPSVARASRSRVKSDRSPQAPRRQHRARGGLDRRRARQGRLSTRESGEGPFQGRRRRRCPRAATISLRGNQERRQRARGASRNVGGPSWAAASIAGRRHGRGGVGEEGVPASVKSEAPRRSTGELDPAMVAKEVAHRASAAIKACLRARRLQAATRR